jgi:hypothetical protein
MALSEVTEDAMMVAGMSLLGTDQARLNMGMPSIVFSAAQGAMEGTLNLVNADTHSEERIEMEIQNQREKDNDVVDIAMAEMTNSVEENLRRLRDGNTAISVGDITLTLDEWKKVGENLKDPEVRNSAEESLRAQGYSEAEIAKIMLIVEAQQRAAIAIANGEPISARDNALIKEGEDNPRLGDGANSTTDKLASDDLSHETKLNITQITGQNAAQTQDLNDWTEIRATMVTKEESLDKAESVRDGIDVGEPDPFADMFAASDEFNPSAQGDVQIAEQSVSNDLAAKVSAPTATL